MSEEKLKLYKGVVWQNKEPEKPGVRVEIYAKDGSEAWQKLKMEYGEDTTVTLHNEEESKKIR